MRTRLGLELWQTLALYLLPPLLIGLAFVWRAIHKATNHPDGILPGSKPKKKAP